MQVDPQLLRATLALPTIEHHALIGSTNDRAIELARDAMALLPALVIADGQTSGRGRGKNRWYSDAGALLFSLAIDPQQYGIDTEHWPLIALTAGLAIAETLADFAPTIPVTLKWPNDVYVGQRKLCGILVEAPSTRPARLVIGAGVNLNNRFDEAPAEIRERATSLASEAHYTFDSTRVLAAIVEHLIELLPWVAVKREELVARYQPRCLLAGRIVSLDTAVGPVVGLCHGIDADGALTIETKCGRQRCLAGTVTHWT